MRPGWVNRYRMRISVQECPLHRLADQWLSVRIGGGTPHRLTVGGRVLQITVDDIAPDQIVGAQRSESERQLLTRQNAARGRGWCIGDELKLIDLHQEPRPTFRRR